MNIKDFAASTAATWNNQTKEENLRHALLGLQSETGELQSAIKKFIGYGRAIDRANVNEELGDLFYFLVQYWRELDGRILDGLELNYTADEFEYVRTKLIYDSLALEELLLDISETVNQLSRYTYAGIRLGAVDKSYRRVKAVKLLHSLAIDARAVATFFEIPLEDCFQINHNKLKARFPEKYTQAAALNRNLAAERSELEKLIDTDAPDAVASQAIAYYEAKPKRVGVIASTPVKVVQMQPAEAPVCGVTCLPGNASCTGWCNY